MDVNVNMQYVFSRSFVEIITTINILIITCCLVLLEDLVLPSLTKTVSSNKGGIVPVLLGISNYLTCHVF